MIAQNRDFLKNGGRIIGHFLAVLFATSFTTVIFVAS
jgi:hypothetical protein